VNGIVEGGWSYVWAAYLVSVLVLGGYAAAVIRDLVRYVTRQR
jgi:hypothetical protein